jgi:hypothetical protein
MHPSGLPRLRILDHVHSLLSPVRYSSGADAVSPVKTAEIASYGAADTRDAAATGRGQRRGNGRSRRHRLKCAPTVAQTSCRGHGWDTRLRASEARCGPLEDRRSDGRTSRGRSPNPLVQTWFPVEKAGGSPQRRSLPGLDPGLSTPTQPRLLHHRREPPRAAAVDERARFNFARFAQSPSRCPRVYPSKLLRACDVGLASAARWSTRAQLRAGCPRLRWRSSRSVACRSCSDPTSSERRPRPGRARRGRPALWTLRRSRPQSSAPRWTRALGRGAARTRQQRCDRWQRENDRSLVGLHRRHRGLYVRRARRARETSRGAAVELRADDGLRSDRVAFELRRAIA